MPFLPGYSVIHLWLTDSVTRLMFAGQVKGHVHYTVVSWQRFLSMFLDLFWPSRISGTFISSTYRINAPEGKLLLCCLNQRNWSHTLPCWRHVTFMEGLHVNVSTSHGECYSLWNGGIMSSVVQEELCQVWENYIFAWVWSVKNMGVNQAGTI